ncbi:MAG: bifunctional (p)ppGpp synthetase/guanosine-3',5'-bis(diphosphate) 3'-pyrophosphohydrolase [Deltaproteobacteria bacterium]|nr:bifunctional (p)ppGpp synthetase/guanosine-3',5'-bis(diphosphate) 3'-pyrophosphohydrolase [Deltaproteobacteria bacterium]
MARINDIIEQVVSYHPEANTGLVQRAYVYSAKVHHGQTRLSGEPYLIHPLGVAKILADLNLDEYTVSTGLLHDTVEDTYATLDEIEKIFGHEVAFLVDGVTKISKIASTSHEERQAENFRKMILAMSKDIRVILVKMADRVHNMRTLQYVPADKQKKIAQQTLDIYAPLANRLGLYEIKSELEDLGLSYTHPEVYQDIESNLVVTAEQRVKYVAEVIGIIEEKLQEFGIKALVQGRPKHIYSIYSKMIDQNLNFTEIYDITAFRIIVLSRQECYEVLGMIHSIWKPVPGRFKDYISMPKTNMYQSLHTTVIGPYGQRIEIQIRTEDMDRIAKQGIAAHWRYKEGRYIQQKDDHRFAWLQQVMETQSELKDSRDFLETFRVDVFPDEVYVFTPAGEVVQLPKGATPVDFAYRIHTSIGNKCIGAKANGAIVPLRYELKTGDVVEILTQANHMPSRDWLKFVKTTRARNKIHQCVKSQERERSLTLGRDICERELRKHKLGIASLHKGADLFSSAGRDVKTLDDLFAAVGQGRVSVKQLINRILPKELTDEKKQDKEYNASVVKKATDKAGRGISVNGIDDLMVRYGKCCNPVHGDDIRGFITRGRGITVHTVECPFLQSSDPDRILDAQWDVSSKHLASVPVEVICDDMKGILADITAAISTTGVNIINARIRTTPEKKAINIFEVEIGSLKQLDAVMTTIRQVKGVIKVTRLRS